MKQQGRPFVYRAASEITYHGIEIGAGPSLLFLHGFTGHKAAYPEFLNQLAAACTVLSLDLPGHGDTAIAAELTCGFTQVADDLAQILESRGPGPTHCVGYSMGGRLALAMALRSPKRVSTLTLIGASPGIASPTMRRRRLARDQDLALFIAQAPVAAFWDYWCKLPLFAHGNSLSAGSNLTPPCPKGSASHLAQSLSLLSTGNQPSFWDALPGLNLPVQLIAGSNDAQYVQVARDMQLRLPHSRIDLIPGAGHRAHVDRPGEVSTRIMGYILQQPLEQHPP